VTAFPKSDVHGTGLAFRAAEKIKKYRLSGQDNKYQCNLKLIIFHTKTFIR